ncbi:MAG: flagellar export chaperone FlgN [Bacillota bacterium]
MRDLCARLGELLSRQEEIVQELCTGVERQIAALQDNDLEALTAAVQGQSHLAAELAALEGARRDVQEALAAALGLRPDASLWTILAWAPAEARAELAPLGERLRAALAALRDTNNICRVMTRRALECNTRVLEALGYGGEAGLLDRTV